MGVRSTPNENAESAASWRAFYVASFDEVSRYALRLTGGNRAAAEDLVHDAYLAMVRSWNAGTVDRLETGWLIVVVRQRFLNSIRSERRQDRRLRLVHAVDTSHEPRFDAVDELLGELPDRSRAALVLRYVDDLPVPEVAAAMRLTVHATESLLARARDQVRRRKGRSHG